MLLIFASGYATRAPGRLLSLTIGFMVLARGLIAFTEHAPFRSQAPPPMKPSMAPPKPSIARSPDHVNAIQKTRRPPRANRHYVAAP